jgi:hypothetical protein
MSTTEVTPQPKEAEAKKPEQEALPEVEGVKVTPETLETYKLIAEKVRLDYEQRFIIWKKTELAEIQKDADDKIRDMVSQFWEKWKAEQEPLTPDKIQLLLNQEYGSFPIKMFCIKEGKEREFIIRELPQKVERKFYRQFQRRVKEYGPMLNAFVQANMGQPFEKQIEAFMEAFDNAFDVLAETVAICIDPFEEEGIDMEWIQNNISSQRQFSIIRAQMEVNRLRDFFSQLYQAGQKMESLMTPLSYQGLQERLR